MSATVYFMKTVNDCKDLSVECLCNMNSEDGHVYFVCILYLSCFTKYNRMHSKHKQIVNIADENLSNYSFLSRYHYTKSKNYLQRR